MWKSVLSRSMPTDKTLSCRSAVLPKSAVKKNLSMGYEIIQFERDTVKSLDRFVMIINAL